MTRVLWKKYRESRKKREKSEREREEQKKILIVVVVVVVVIILIMIIIVDSVWRWSGFAETEEISSKFHFEPFAAVVLMMHACYILYLYIYIIYCVKPTICKWSHVILYSEYFRQSNSNTQILPPYLSEYLLSMLSQRGTSSVAGNDTRS